MFFRHLQLNELTVTGVTGDTKLKNATAPVSIISPQVLRATASTNIIDAIAHQPGVSQLTTGGSISKPIIRGLGYNRVVVMSEGVRQEGQQWGDEHGVEVDGSSVGSVEILKGPASLMYGSDAMAGVVILHAQPTLAEGELKGNISSEYQTNSGLFHYSLQMAGNQKGFVWDARYSDKMAHAYKNKYDDYVPGSQFRERAGRLMLGVNKAWGHSRLVWTAYHLTPSIIEGVRSQETGELEHEEDWTGHQYGKSLPFQQVKHYKAVWDNSLNLSSGYLKAIIGYQQNRRQEFEESEDDYELFFKLHTLTYDLRYITNEWNGWKLSTGIGGMYQKSGNEGEEYLIPDYRLFDFGVYATATKAFGERWTLSGGLRYDHRRLHGDMMPPKLGGDRGLNNDTASDPLPPNLGGSFTRHFNGLTGSIGAVCNINDHFNLRLNLARGFRTPNMSELASNGVHEGSLRYELGNQQLKAEYSLQADLGLDFTSRYVSAQLALFANRINNYIFIRGEGQEVRGERIDYPVYIYTQGDARLLGFEAGVDFHPVHSVHFSNSFSYVDAQLLHADADTKYLPFTPAPKWSSELKWELFHHSHSTVNHHHTTDAAHRSPLNNLYIALGLDCFLRQTHIYRADETETETPGYALLSLSAGTDIQVKGRKIAEFYVTADNLLDKAYQNHLSRLKYTDVNVVTGRRGVYNMGRNITFKVVITIN
ncbi:MAG: TonB-dependent receptor [Prevotella sp.]|nr:TonB-dependent receptor [Prevotella sp.]